MDRVQAGAVGRAGRKGSWAQGPTRPGRWQKPAPCPAPTKPLVELLHLTREAQLREVARVDEHIAVRHLDGVCPGVGVGHADEAGVAGRLGGIVRHWVHPAGGRHASRGPGIRVPNVYLCFIRMRARFLTTQHRPLCGVLATPTRMQGLMSMARLKEMGPRAAHTPGETGGSHGASGRGAERAVVFQD